LQRRTLMCYNNWRRCWLKTGLHSSVADRWQKKNKIFFIMAVLCVNKSSKSQFFFLNFGTFSTFAPFPYNIFIVKFSYFFIIKRNVTIQYSF
jgi:hypothetical protein